MDRNLPEPDPRSEFEDEGIPDLQDSTPEREWAADPQVAPLPAEKPVAVDDYGTTAGEQQAGEPLDLRVAREIPEEQPAFGTDDPVTAEPADVVPGRSRPAGRLVEPDEGARPDDEEDAFATEAGPDAGGYSAEEEAMRVDVDESELAGRTGDRHWPPCCGGTGGRPTQKVGSCRTQEGQASRPSAS